MMNSFQACDLSEKKNQRQNRVLFKKNFQKSAFLQQNSNLILKLFSGNFAELINFDLILR